MDKKTLFLSKNSKSPGDTKHMHIRGGNSNSFGLEYCQIDILGPNRAEIMLMIFLTSNFVALIFLGSLEVIMTSICIVSLLHCSCRGF